jgi:selenocysteine lyase/cysteine desulfurase
MADTLHFDPSTEAATLSKSRHAVCLEAVWEIEAMTVVLPGLVGVDASGNSMSHFVVRAVAARLNQLANALLAGLDDPAVTVRELHKTVLLDAEG